MFQTGIQQNAEGNEESTKVTEPEKQLETEKHLEEKTSDASANITIEDASAATEIETKEITILSEEKIEKDVAETADQATKGSEGGCCRRNQVIKAILNH